ncbi:hypothetical protein [Streptomyces sp. NPDC049040]|uniref:hypothetical protein n=1 Tax=Streptomyces sp. NPDC049040 TaxID=3365593 RepID=UPI00371F3962
MSDEAAGEPPDDMLSGSGDPATGAIQVRTPRPWLWAVGGIAVASAVWAAVLHGTGGAAPDLHGYRLSDNPCSGDALNPLKTAVGGPGFTASNATVSHGPALDKLFCVLNSVSQAGNGQETAYTIGVGVELHKKTDPRAEFENTRHARVSNLPGSTGGSNGSPLIGVADSGFTSAADVHPVTGIGDEGYLLSSHAAGQTLVVLHGGAVLTLQITGYTEWNSTDGSGAGPGDSAKDPDLTHLRPALTSAMRRLMASLAS